MKKTELLKRAQSTIVAIALILGVGALTFLSSCKDEEEVSPVVGTWVITSATLNAQTPYEVPAEYTGGTQTVLPAGQDITLLFGGILANAGPCQDPSKTAVELTKDQKMLYVCIGETTAPDETGSWLISSDGKVLTISINTEQGGTPVTVPLNLSDFVVSSTTLSGTISDFSFFPADNPPLNLQTVSMDVSFTKVPG